MKYSMMFLKFTVREFKINYFLACDCYKDGTIGGLCRPNDGVCDCKDGWYGIKCDKSK